MIRAQVQFEPEQYEQIQRLAAASGRSMAGLVREGVDLLLKKRQGNCRRWAELNPDFRERSLDDLPDHDAGFVEMVQKSHRTGD